MVPEPSSFARQASEGGLYSLRIMDSPPWTRVPGHSAGCLVPQTKRCVAGNVLEVPIWTEEFGFEVEACLRNDAVDGPAHGNSHLPERAEQTRCSNVAIHRRLDHGQGHENSLSLPETLTGRTPRTIHSDVGIWRCPTARVQGVERDHVSIGVRGLWIHPRGHLGRGLDSVTKPERESSVGL